MLARERPRVQWTMSPYMVVMLTMLGLCIWFLIVLLTMVYL